MEAWAFPPVLTQLKMQSFFAWDSMLNLAKAYFQLQFGCVFLPLKVNCFTFVPSASMDQICSLPERLDWKTI